MIANSNLIVTISIALQYVLIALIYFFLCRVITLAWKDVRQGQEEARPARLVVIAATDNDAPGKVYIISASLSIGRNEHNDIVINDSFVSSEHACITVRKHSYLLTDLASTNGTYVNDRKIEADMPLAPGDRIIVGPVTFKFER